MAQPKPWSGAWCVFAALGLSVPLAAQASQAPSTERTIEVRANTYTKSTQHDAALDIAPNGNVLVAWGSRRQEMGSYGIFGQLFDGLGRPLGTELHINEYMPHGQVEPAVAFASDGSAWVAWTSFEQDGSGGGVYLRRLSAEGATLTADGIEVQANQTALGDQVDPSICALANGNLVVSWLTATVEGERLAMARVFDGSGQAVGDEFALGEDASGLESLPTLAAAGEGFVAAWARTAGDGKTPAGVYTRTFNAAGEATTSEFMASGNDFGAVEPSLDGYAEGFALAWMSLSSSGEYQVRSQAFGLDGQLRGAAHCIDAPQTGFQNGAIVAMDESGAYTLLFNRFGFAERTGSQEDGIQSTVWSQEFSVAGAPVGDLVALGTSDARRDLQVGSTARHAARSEGSLAIAWNGSIKGDTNGVGLTLRVPGDLDLPTPPEVTPVAALAGLDRNEVDGQIAPPEWDPNWVDDSHLDSQFNSRMNTGFRAFTSTGWNPPDPDLAVGTNHVVAVVNVDMRFFTKDGTQTFNTGLESFFNTTGFVFDPVALYDPIEDRYVVVAIEHGSGGRDLILLGVSDDGDPNGTWHKYSFDVTSVCDFIDFQNLGMTDEAYVVSADCFGSPGGNYIHVIEKAPTLTGAAVTPVSIQANTSLLSNGATKNYDDGTAYLASAWALGSPKLKIYAVTDPGTNPVLEKVNLDVGAWSSPPNAPQLGTSNRADTIDTRIKNGVVRDGYLYLTHNVGNGGVCRVRWYKIDLRGWPTSGVKPQLEDSGYVNPGAGLYTWYGDVNVDANGNMAIAYNRSSSSEYIGVYWTWRAAGDAPGTLRDHTELQTSTSAETGSRWGDYSGLEQDPTNPAKFWSHHEYRTTSWRTWAGEFELPIGGPPIDLQLGGPLVAGTLATATAAGSSPFATVYLYNGSGLGSTTVPGVGDLEIANGRLILTETADASGQASYSRNLPAGLAGRTVYLQIIDEFGALSQVVSETVQ